MNMNLVKALALLLAPAAVFASQTALSLNELPERVGQMLAKRLLQTEFTERVHFQYATGALSRNYPLVCASVENVCRQHFSELKIRILHRADIQKVGNDSCFSGASTEHLLLVTSQVDAPQTLFRVKQVVEEEEDISRRAKTAAWKLLETLVFEAVLSEGDVDQKVTEHYSVSLYGPASQIPWHWIIPSGFFVLAAAVGVFLFVKHRKDAKVDEESDPADKL